MYNEYVKRVLNNFINSNKDGKIVSGMDGIIMSYDEYKENYIQLERERKIDELLNGKIE